MDVSSLLLNYAPLLIFFVISFLQSITGFGLVIVATPLLMMIYDAKQVVLIVQLASMLINGILGFGLVKDMDKKLLLLLCAGAILGQPIGFFFYNIVSADALRIGISCLILFFLAIMQRKNLTIQESPPRSGIVGFVCGALNACTGIGGPPLILYLAQTGRSLRTLRASTVAFFGIINFTVVARYVFDGRDLSFAAAQVFHAMPGALVGLLIGNYAFKRVSVPLFRKILFTMLTAVSIYTIYLTLARA